MNNYIENLITIISDCSMDNTYKMSWCRALVELSYNNPNQKKIHFDEISALMFKYYWDQTIFFNLEQGPNYFKRPVINQIVKDEISAFQKKYGNIPKKYINSNYNISKTILNKITTKLTHDVSYKFLYVNKKIYNIYDYKKGDKYLILKRPDLIKENHKVLFSLINYKWTQQLENINPGTPKIAQKVRGIDRENEPKRKSLKKFKFFLDLENPEHICFITGEKILNKELSIDHVIPWSYMYSDDLWNLVYVKRSENSSLSNKIKNEKIIEKLIKRNQKLVRKMETLNISNTQTKEFELLRLANENNGNKVKQFWIGSKAQN